MLTLNAAQRKLADDLLEEAASEITLAKKSEWVASVRLPRASMLISAANVVMGFSGGAE